VASVSTIVNYVHGHPASEMYLSNGRVNWDPSRYTIKGVNENDLALTIALALPMCLYLGSRAPNRLVRWWFWLQFGAGAATILLTGSRGGLIAAVIGLTVFLASLARRSVLKSAGAFLICGAILTTGLYATPA